MKIATKNYVWLGDGMGGEEGCHESSVADVGAYVLRDECLRIQHESSDIYYTIDGSRSKVNRRLRRVWRST